MPRDLDAQVAAWSDHFGLVYPPPLNKPEDYPLALIRLRSVFFDKQLTIRQYWDVEYEIRRIHASLNVVEPVELKRAREAIGNKNLQASASIRREVENARYAKSMETKGDGSYRPLFKW